MKKALKMTLRCRVTSSPEVMWQSHTQELFLALKPPLVPLKLLRFDGCKTGDEVHLQVSGQLWVSVITEAFKTPQECRFVDEGKVLPFPLRYWRHAHIMRQEESGPVMIDAIEFSSGRRWLDFILWPLLWPSFKWRHPIYRRLWGKP